MTSSGWPCTPPAALTAAAAAFPASASSGTLLAGPVAVTICMTFTGVPVRAFAVVGVAPGTDDVAPPPVLAVVLALEPQLAAMSTTAIVRPARRAATLALRTFPHFPDR